MQNSDKTVTTFPNLTAKDRRRAPRYEVHRYFQIIFDVDAHKQPCLVHNISEKGAMLEYKAGPLPEKFMLEDEEKGFLTACRIAWSCGDLAGVEFVGSEVKSIS